MVAIGDTHQCPAVSARIMTISIVLCPAVCLPMMDLLGARAFGTPATFHIVAKSYTAMSNVQPSQKTVPRLC